MSDIKNITKAEDLVGKYVNLEGHNGIYKVLGVDEAGFYLGLSDMYMSLSNYLGKYFISEEDYGCSYWSCLLTEKGYNLYIDFLKKSGLKNFFFKNVDTENPKIKRLFFDKECGDGVRVQITPYKDGTYRYRYEHDNSLMPYKKYLADSKVFRNYAYDYIEKMAGEEGLGISGNVIFSKDICQLYFKPHSNTEMLYLI